MEVQNEIYHDEDDNECEDLQFKVVVMGNGTVRILIGQPWIDSL